MQARLMSVTGAPEEKRMISCCVVLAGRQEATLLVRRMMREAINHAISLVTPFFLPNSSLVAASCPDIAVAIIIAIRRL